MFICNARNVNGKISKDIVSGQCGQSKTFSIFHFPFLIFHLSPVGSTKCKRVNEDNGELRIPVSMANEKW